MLVTSIFSFFHNVFQILLPQGHEKSGLCGKGLKINFVMERVENIVGKGEHVGYLHFLTIFSKGLFVRVVLKSRLCGRVKHLPDNPDFLMTSNKKVF